MEILKTFLTILLVLGILIVSLPFVFFALQPFSPEVISKMTDKDWDLKTEFQGVNLTDWAKVDGKLVYLNKSNKFGELTLKTTLIPSEKKKLGYITSSVITNGKLAMLPKDGFMGFRLGEECAEKESQILMGVDGRGDLVVMDGNRKDLKISTRGSKMKEVNEETKLSFHYYKNPYGWIIFFNKQQGGVSETATINHIPYSNLNDLEKDFSLIVYNPTQQGEAWFKDWEIQNDWTPND